jgi:hypothetical protein
MTQEPAYRFAGESIINFLSNEDIQELAPGFFIRVLEQPHLSGLFDFVVKNSGADFYPGIYADALGFSYPR